MKITNYLTVGENQETGKKKLVRVFLLLCIISVVLGGIMELGIACIEYKKAGGYQGKQAVRQDAVQLDSVWYEDGNYIVPKGGGTVSIKTEGQYINKLQYEYLTEKPFVSPVTVTVLNHYGEEEVIVLPDDARNAFVRSVISIHKQVTNIRIDFQNPDAEIEVSGFLIDNSFKPNPVRAIFCAGLVFLPLFLILFRKAYCGRVEWAFAVVAMVLGVIMLIALPPHCSSWDEHIHFNRCCVLAHDKDVTVTVTYLTDYSEGSETAGSRSFGERIDEIKLLNAHYQEPDDRDYGERELFQLVNVGYLFQALAIVIGDVLHLPFYLIWILGKLANLVLYVVVMFWAIRKTPIGKQLLCVLGLAPTAMFLATAYTYDVTVNAFIVLGCAILVKAFVKRDEYMPKKEQALFIACMIIGSCPKAVYIPLILAGLFLPEKKFATKREKYLFRGVIGAGFLLMMSTFVLPALISPSAGGDSRGGDHVSVSGQLQYVLGQPLAYARVLWENVTRSFLRMDFGRGIEIGGLTDLGFLGKITQPTLYLVFLVLVIVTDRYQEEKRGVYPIGTKNKVVIGASIVLTVALIWTALYLSFNNMGVTEINGVQGRYYIPFLWLLFMILQTDKVHCTLARSKYQIITFLIAAAFVMEAIFNLVIVVTCF